MAALSSSASAVLRFVGWSFLPSALADGAIRSYHRILKPGSPVPQRGTPSYATAYRIAFTTLAGIYLLYTLVAAVTSLQPNYYSILGVPRDADEQALKAAFRQFARKNHPDRPGIGAAGAGRFREVRDAYEMLKNPVKRFAYERFGPEIISWKDCTTVKEYMRRGLSASSGFPIGTVIVLGLMSVLGQSSSSSFWRYAMLATALFAEVYLIVSPTVPLTPSYVLPSYTIPFLSWLLPYQQILVLHQAFVSFSVCLSQLGPVLFPNAAKNDREVIKAVSDVIQRIAGVGGAAEHEVNRMIQSELRTLRGVRPAPPSPQPSFTQAAADDEAALNALTTEMEALIIDARLRAHPVIGSMWERVADDARDRLATVTSPVQATRPIPELAASVSQNDQALGQQSYDVNQSMLASALATSSFDPPAAVVPSAQAGPSYSRATSPITSTQPPIIDVLAPPLEPAPVSAGVLSDSEQLEDTATLIGQGRSRSVSPFIMSPTNWIKTRDRTTSAGSNSTLLSAAAAQATEAVMDSASSNDALPESAPGDVFQIPRSFGRSSGAKIKQFGAPASGNGQSMSGPKFFTSAFSSS